MNLNKSKYRNYTILTILVYLNFSFLAPLFHYHYAEESPHAENNFHSHLSGDLDMNNDHQEKEYFEIDNEQHEHIFQLNYVPFIIPNKSLHSSLEFCIANFKTPFILWENSRSENILEKCLPTQVLWERFVLSGANTSPPIS